MRYRPTKATRGQVDTLDPDLNQRPCVLLDEERVLLQKMQDGTVAEVRLEPTWRKDANAVLADGEMANLGGPRVIVRIGTECFEADLPEPLHITGNTKQPVLFGMAMRPFHIVFGGNIDDVRNEVTAQQTGAPGP